MNKSMSNGCRWRKELRWHNVVARSNDRGWKGEGESEGEGEGESAGRRECCLGILVMVNRKDLN